MVRATPRRHRLSRTDRPLYLVMVYLTERSATWTSGSFIKTVKVNVVGVEPHQTETLSVRRAKAMSTRLIVKPMPSATVGKARLAVHQQQTAHNS